MSANEYSLIGLSENPFKSFDTWFKKAKDSGIDPTPMTLASVNSNSYPETRIVLLKDYNEEVFKFYTNYESAKGKQLDAHPKASLVFHWTSPEHRQVRIIGDVKRTTKEDSQMYFSSRIRGSRISAIASPQSHRVDSRAQLEELHQKVDREYPGEDIQCPDYWGGYQLAPIRFEFWQEREFRFHDRFEYRLENNTWKIQRLAP